jgi:Flp pilus assembly protein TadG
MTVSVENTADESPVRVCPTCSTQSQAAGDFCPHCGGRFSKRRRSRRTRLLLVGVPLLLLLIGGGVAAGLIIHNNQQAANRKHAAARAAAHARALAAQRQDAAQKLQRAEQRLKQTLARDTRAAIVKDLQAAVKKDAQKDVNDGTLNGPVLNPDCQPASASDATAPIARYTCLAVTSIGGDGTERGYRFSGTINLSTGSYTWQLGG